MSSVCQSAYPGFVQISISKDKNLLWHSSEPSDRIGRFIKYLSAVLVSLNIGLM